jgi:Na+/proline symporter
VSEVTCLTGARVLIISISVVTGSCFTVLAGLSISAIAVPVRRFHVTSIVVAVVTICLGWLAFRSAVAGFTHEESDEDLVAPMRRGVIGAFLGLIMIVALLLMFGTDARGLLAHALAQRSSSFTPFRLLIAGVLLGFGTGFTARIPGTNATRSRC